MNGKKQHPENKKTAKVGISLAVFQENRRNLQTQQSDCVFFSDLVEYRLADLAFGEQLLEEVHQADMVRFAGSRANINTEHEFILEFVQEFDGIFFVAGKSVAARTGGEVAVEVVVLTHKFRHGTFDDFAFGITGTLVRSIQNTDFRPESLAVGKDFHAGEPLKGFRQTGQTGFIIDTVASAVAVCHMDGHGPLHFFNSTEKIGHKGVKETHIADDFADTLATGITILLENIFDLGERVVPHGTRVDVAERYESAGEAFSGFKNIFVGLRQIEFRADQRQQNSFFDFVLIVELNKLVRGRPGLASGQLEKRFAIGVSTPVLPTCISIDKSFVSFSSGGYL